MSKKHALKIGKIAYTNLFPVFYALKEKYSSPDYEFIEGVPFELNKMLREGQVDISPSSSVEYLRYPDNYMLIEGHSISSAGAVGSILFFSRSPIETLAGETVLTSLQSETSVALLDIILQKFIGVKCSFRPADLRFLISTPEAAVGRAFLLIGDDALRYRLMSAPYRSFFVYDLGELWYRYTGLFFVFALWIAGKDLLKEKGEIYLQFLADINKAKCFALENLELIASVSPLRELLTEDGLVSYWKSMSYDFDSGHQRGLELFRKYAEELGHLNRG